jgi:hypothetical protein
LTLPVRNRTRLIAAIRLTQLITMIVTILAQRALLEQFFLQNYQKILHQLITMHKYVLIFWAPTNNMYTK